MAGQMQELLLKVSSELEGVERVLADMREELRDQSKDMGETRERLASLENDRRWTGEERRKVDERLGSGDHTFLKLQADIKEAGRIAAEALKLAQQKGQVQVKEPETKTFRKKFTDKLIDHGVKALFWLLLLALYHILLAGPKIAEAIKPHGGHP